MNKGQVSSAQTDFPQTARLSNLPDISKIFMQNIAQKIRWFRWFTLVIYNLFAGLQRRK